MGEDRETKAYRLPVPTAVASEEIMQRLIAVIKGGVLASVGLHAADQPNQAVASAEASFTVLP